MDSHRYLKVKLAFLMENKVRKMLIEHVCFFSIFALSLEIFKSIEICYLKVKLAFVTENKVRKMLIEHFCYFIVFCFKLEDFQSFEIRAIN